MSQMNIRAWYISSFYLVMTAIVEMTSHQVLFFIDEQQKQSAEELHPGGPHFSKGSSPLRTDLEPP